MERTKLVGYYANITLLDLDCVEELMSKEELKELRIKTEHIMNSLCGIEDIQTFSLMASMFRRGYLAAHVDLGKNTK